MHSRSYIQNMGVQSSHRKSHFAPAFLFLSRERRKALATLYAVCRVLDDAVDENRSDVVEFLKSWRTVFSDRTPDSVEVYQMDGLARDFLAVVEKYGLPLNAMSDLIDKGVAMDLEKNRFQTAMDLESYCYGVAGTVGLACLPIFGVPINEGKMFAVRLGIAVQWVNTIRDVGVDAEMGRIYLPLDHLEQFGYTEDELFGRKYSDNFKELMKFEFAAAQSHFQRAWELLPAGHYKSLLPARVMGAIYQKLLLKIKDRGYPVLHEKIKLTQWEKLAAVWAALRQK